MITIVKKMSLVVASLVLVLGVAVSISSQVLAQVSKDSGSGLSISPT